MTWLLITLMYMLGVTVKVTVISRLLSAERYRGMDSFLGKLPSWKVKLGLTKPRRAKGEGGERERERERERGERERITGMAATRDHFNLRTQGWLI